MKYRRCIFGGKKAPAGAHLDAPSLESICFMCLRRKNTGSAFINIEGVFLMGRKPLRERTQTYRT